MTFPTLPLLDGCLRPLVEQDTDAIFELCQHQSNPGFRAMSRREQAAQLPLLATAVYRQKAGCIWGLEYKGAFIGLLHFYEWQPDVRRGTLRLDCSEAVPAALITEALTQACLWLEAHWQVHCFVMHLVDGLPLEKADIYQQVGFKKTARLRDYWHVSDDRYLDVDYYCRMEDAA